MKKQTIRNAVIIIFIAIAIILVGRYLNFFAIYPDTNMYTSASWEGDNYILTGEHNPRNNPAYTVVYSRHVADAEYITLGYTPIEKWVSIFYGTYLNNQNVKVVNSQADYNGWFGVCDEGLTEENRIKLRGIGLKLFDFTFYDNSRASGVGYIDGVYNTEEIGNAKKLPQCTIGNSLNIKVWLYHIGKFSLNLGDAYKFLASQVINRTYCAVEGTNYDTKQSFKSIGDIMYSDRPYCIIKDNIGVNTNDLKTTFYFFQAYVKPISYVAPTQEQPIPTTTQPIQPTITQPAQQTNQTETQNIEAPKVNIAGIVIAIIAFILAIGVLIFLLFKMKKR